MILGSQSSEILQKTWKRKEKRGEMLPKPKRSCLEDLLGVVCNLHLQNMSLSCKNSKQKLAGNAAKNTNKSYRNFCVYTEISSKQI
jgi:hypothetical protein